MEGEKKNPSSIVGFIVLKSGSARLVEPGPGRFEAGTGPG